MTDNERKLPEAGDALADATERSALAQWPWEITSQQRALMEYVHAWRAIAREVKESSESPAQLVASAVKQGTKDMGFTPSDAERKRLAARLFDVKESSDDA